MGRLAANPDTEEESVNKFRTRYMALPVCVGLIALTGCGSSSSSKTKPAAPASTPANPSTAGPPRKPTVSAATEQRIRAAVQPFLAAVQQLQANPQSAKDPNTYTHLGSTLSSAASQLHGISVPAADRLKLDRAVVLMKRAAAVADQMGTDLKNNNHAAFQADGRKFQRIGQELSAL
jgi:hypothetical protein